ncbi:unnamed protein product [marine sediment metagenome]|uniref:Poly A polymerase head domain-containing protein n=1 Tax=marine sediment metagenome TaxID=412755 RepID=X1P1N6_9ZZZZ
MSSLKQINVIAILARVSRLLSHQGHRGYIVGGFIRDWFLGRQTNDIDIAVDGDALNIAEEVAKSLGGKFVLLDEVNNIAREFSTNSFTTEAGLSITSPAAILEITSGAKTLIGIQDNFTRFRVFCQ